MAIELFHSREGSRALKTNHENLPLGGLESALEPLLHDDTRKTVLLKADGQLAFAGVAQVADRCLGV